MEDLEMSRDFKIDFQAWKNHSNYYVVNSIIHEIEISLCECHLYIKINLKKTLKTIFEFGQKAWEPFSSFLS